LGPAADGLGFVHRRDTEDVLLDDDLDAGREVFATITDVRSQREIGPVH
jgi:hypothetical protein